MSHEQYYCLELNDCSAPSFCSFGKDYFGTMEEIRLFINALDKRSRDSHRELVAAFRAYEAGQKNVTHHAAFQEVPLLTPARLVHSEKLTLESYRWEHLNVWECVYEMRCERADTEHLWLDCGGSYIRAIKANFTNPQYAGDFEDWLPFNEEMFWGFPCILKVDSGHLWNVLAEPERSFRTLEELEQDWEAFKKDPDPQFQGICDDIYGDG